MKSSINTVTKPTLLNRWGRRGASALALLGVFALGAPVQAGSAPAQFTQQGRLLAEDGTPVNDTVEMTFRLYDAENGGAMLWEQVQQVEAANGFYTVTLGSEDNPLDMMVLRDGTAWLAMAVDAGEEMSPRQRLNSVPYAIIAQRADVAKRAETVADGSITAASIAPGAINDANIAEVDWAKVTNMPEGVFDSRYASHQAAGWFFEAESTPVASLGIGSSTNDPSASNAATRSALASEAPSASGVAGRMWGVSSSELGTSLAHGPIHATVRAKVTNTGSSQVLAQITCASMRGGTWNTFAPVSIVPSEFGGNNSWKEFVIYCDFAPDDEDQFLGVENFTPSITDLYIDYARVAPLSSVPFITSEQIVDGTIQNVDIKNSTIQGGKLADRTITGNKIATGSITGNEISDGSIGTADLGNSSVTNSKLADNSVTGNKIANGSISGADIANDTITSQHITQIGIQTFNCTWSGYVNNFDAVVNYTCPGDKVLKGVYSTHDNGREDRRFNYQCCSMRLK